MNKPKRYIKEFALDIIRRYKNTSIYAEKKIKVEKILRYVEKGLVTDFEAMQMLVDICKKKL